MDIFWRLLLGHFLADFTFQTNHINKWKRESLVGMTVHCLMHPIFYVLLTYSYLDQPWITWMGIPISGVWAIAVITALHFLEDYWRIYTIKRFKTPDNTLYLLWDQIIHISVIFIFFGISSTPAPKLLGATWPIIGILAIGATHFSVVLVYFIESDLFGSSYPADGEKYLAICERLLAFGFLLLVTPALLAWLLAIVSLVAPRVELQRLLKAKKIPDGGWALGSLVALLCGLAGRYILATFA